MTTLTTFLTLFEEFCNELEATFPNETKKLNSYKIKYETMKQANPRKILELFLEHISPFYSYIVNKDDSIIMEEKSQILKDMGLKTYWTMDTCTENTKEAIWAHLNTLYILASTINTIPQDLLQNIEQMAKQCADGFQQNGNEKDLMLGMQKMLQSQMGNLKM